MVSRPLNSATKCLGVQLKFFLNNGNEHLGGHGFLNEFPLLPRNFLMRSCCLVLFAAAKDVEVNAYAKSHGGQLAQLSSQGHFLNPNAFLAKSARQKIMTRNCSNFTRAICNHIRATIQEKLVHGINSMICANKVLPTLIGNLQALSTLEIKKQ